MEGNVSDALSPQYYRMSGLGGIGQTIQTHPFVFKWGE